MVRSEGGSRRTVRCLEPAGARSAGECTERGNRTWPTDAIGNGVKGIDRIRIRNFKCFDQTDLELNPRSALLVGDNATGKTTMLDALAMATGVWLVKPPDSALVGSGGNILPGEIRLLSKEEGDRTQFLECKPVSVEATGELVGRTARRCRQIRKDGTRTTNADAKAALEIIERHFARVQDGQGAPGPVIARCGAGRAWLPSRSRREQGTRRNGPARGWEASHDCFNERIRPADLDGWFRREALTFANRSGSWLPGHGAVKQAVLRCAPDANSFFPLTAKPGRLRTSVRINE